MKVLIVVDERIGYSTIKAIAEKREFAVVSTVEGMTHGNPYCCFRDALKELAEKVGLKDYISFDVTVAHVTSGEL